jgi:multidrug resistance efflux pump
VFDQSNATFLTAEAQVDQAQRQLDLANHNLERGKLLAPFKGTIAGIEVKSFGQVAAGQGDLTLYSDDRFEMSLVVALRNVPKPDRWAGGRGEGG